MQIQLQRTALQCPKKTFTMAGFEPTIVCFDVGDDDDCNICTIMASCSKNLSQSDDFLEELIP
jgi:hypothetical protein